MFLVFADENNILTITVWTNTFISFIAFFCFANYIFGNFPIAKAIYYEYNPNNQLSKRNQYNICYLTHSRLNLTHRILHLIYILASVSYLIWKGTKSTIHGNRLELSLCYFCENFNLYKLSKKGLKKWEPKQKNVKPLYYSYLKEKETICFDIRENVSREQNRNRGNP